MKNILFFICMSLFALINSVLAQQGDLRGKVTDESGEPLMGVTVTLGGSSKGTTTDENGFYRLANISVGNQTFVFSYVGFKTEYKEIYFNPTQGNHNDPHLHLNITLYEDNVSLQEVEVIGRQESSYKNTNTFSGMKTAMAVKEIPQSINYVTKELILDQGATTVNDVVKNTSGVNQYTTYNDFSIRGFRTTGNRNSGNMINGMRAQTSLWKQSSLANVERVEIIKGPASALFGNAQPGGIINRVTKKPLLENQNTISLTAGSFNTYKTYGDFTGPLNKSKSLLYRLNLGYESTDTFRDLQGSENLIFAPSFSFIPNEKTRINVDFVYQNLNGKIDRGQTIFGDADLYSVPISRSLAASNDFLKEKTTNLTIGFTHKFTENLSFNSTFLNSTYTENLQEHNQANAYYMQLSGQAESGDNTKILMQALLRNRFFRNNSFNNYINYNFNTSIVKHKLLVGYDYFQTDLMPGSSQLTAGGYLLQNGSTTTVYNTSRYTYQTDANGNPLTNVPIFDLNDPLSGNGMKDISKYIFTKSSTAPYQQYSNGIYIQEHLEISMIKLLLGLRQEYFVDYLNYKQATESKVTQKALLPRIGLVVTASPNVNLYSTWVKGFETQSAAIQADPERYGGPFDPVYSELYEIGAKTEWFDKRLSATLSVFDITQKNALYAASPAVVGKPDLLMQVGEERSKGFEVDVMGQILPNWSIVANYAYTDARITKTASNSEVDFDMQRPSTPRHAGNFWTKYIIKEGVFQNLGVGLGYNFVTERFGQVGRRTNTTVYPGYGLFNAAIYYQVSGIQLQLNLNNIMNKTHWVGGYDKLRSFPGAPRNINATVSYQF
ncbi:MAG: TonB-dependent receptor [Capnocytophaga sp.]|nr:TonB-dependent receptor [Capnocytophaga sp.]